MLIGLIIWIGFIILALKMFEITGREEPHVWRREMIQYLDGKGRLLFISSGIGENAFGTFYRGKQGGGKHRIKSPNLPIRKTRKDAENDLTWYALEHDLIPVTVSHVE